jgi:drug/metabolite transporter (DMT)-like permease
MAPAAAGPARGAGTREYLTLALLALIWGTTWAAIRIGLGGIAPFTGVALRFAIAAAVLAAVARWLGVPVASGGGRGGAAGDRAKPAGDRGTVAGELSGPAGPRGGAASDRGRAASDRGGAASDRGGAASDRSGAARDRSGAGARPWRVWLANGALTFFVAYGVLYWAEQWVPSGLAAVLFATSPLWVSLWAHLALPGERFNAATVAGVVVGFAGVAVIFSQDLAALGGPRVAGAAALLLVSPLASALGVVAVKRWGGGLHPLTITTVPMALAAIAMGCIAAAVEGARPPRWDAVSVAALLYLALVGSALPFALYFWLLGRLPATTTSLINYVTPLVALLLGSAALGERVTLRTLGGAALVVGGVAVALRGRSAGSGGSGGSAAAAASPEPIAAPLGDR